VQKIQHPQKTALCSLAVRTLPIQLTEFKFPSFSEQFRGDIATVLSMVSTFGSEHETQCGQLTGSIREQLQARAAQLQQLSDALRQTVAAQQNSLTALTDLSTNQESADRDWLAGYSDLCSTATAGSSQLSRELQENRLGPLLVALNSCLVEQSQQLNSLEETIRTDHSSLVSAFSVFVAELTVRMRGVRSAVDSYAVEMGTALADLSRENAAIQAKKW
jgi:hypothetical protein